MNRTLSLPRVLLARSVMPLLAMLLLPAAIAAAQAGEQPDKPAAAADDAAQEADNERVAELEKYRAVEKKFQELAGKRSTTTDDERDALEKEISKVERELFSLHATLKQMGIDDPGNHWPGGGSQASPSTIDVGDVYVGSTVEASVRVFFDPKKLRGFYNDKDTAGLGVKVNPPVFAKAKRIDFDSGQYGRNVLYCDVCLSIVTARPGHLSGDLRVEVGGERVEIPISATVLPADPAATRILVVSSPFSGWSTSNSSEFAPWLEIVKNGKLNADYWLAGGRLSPLRSEDLSKFDVVFVQDDGVFFLQKRDVENLKKFLSDGGRVVITASHFFMGTVERANDLISSYGLQMVDSELHVAQVLKGGGDIFEDPLTSDVHQVSIFRATPIAMTQLTDAAPGTQTSDSRKILIKYPKEAMLGFIASAKAGKGQIIAIGVPLWWTWIGKEQKEGCDNAKLLQNLLTFHKEREARDDPQQK